MEQIKEIPAFKLNGFAVLAALGAIASFAAWQSRGIVAIANTGTWDTLSFAQILYPALLILSILLLLGFITVQPNQARVLVFLGSYSGTIRTAGFWWVNPLASKLPVSLRVRNFNSETLKVNDAQGSPIEIGAVVVWRVVDSAKALFDVDDYQKFVAIQTETAIRALAIRYPYDTGEEDGASLRGSPDEIATALKQEVQARLEVAGVEVIETRLSHLAYAPEIAQVMLRRQQAQAIIAARRLLVEGAVSVVEMAINQLGDRQIIALDDDRKAAMINNLLVVLTSENNTQPVVNTGSLQP